MKKLFTAIVITVSLVSFSGSVVQAKNCVGYCPGVSSNSGNPYNVYKPRDTYVNGYTKQNGQYVQGYTRSKRCTGWSC
jgi:hypothetical protein